MGINHSRFYQLRVKLAEKRCTALNNSKLTARWKFVLRRMPESFSYDSTAFKNYNEWFWNQVVPYPCHCWEIKVANMFPIEIPFLRTTKFLIDIDDCLQLSKRTPWGKIQYS